MTTRICEARRTGPTDLLNNSHHHHIRNQIVKLTEYIEIRKKQIDEFKQFYEGRCEDGCPGYLYDDDMCEEDWLEQEMAALPDD